MTSSAPPWSVAVRVSVPDEELQVLFLVVQYLRSLGLSTTVVALLRESGVDPLWLCGQSREVALLRESVLLGEWGRVAALLRPLRAVLNEESYATATAVVEKQALMEEFYFVVGSTEEKAEQRRAIMGKLLDEQRDKAGRLTRGEMEACMRVLKSSATPVSSCWSLDEARLNCFEKLVPIFRSEISTEDEESKYISMAPRQLVGLLNDATLLHQRDKRGRQGEELNLISLTPISSDTLPSHSKDGFSSLRLVEIASSPTRMPREDLSRSVGLTELRNKDIMTGSSSEQARGISAGRESRVARANPLIMSIDFSRARRRNVPKTVDCGVRSPLEARVVQRVLVEPAEGEDEASAGERFDATTQTEQELASSFSQTESTVSEPQFLDSSFTDAPQSGESERSRDSISPTDLCERNQLSTSKHLPTPSDHAFVSADPPLDPWCSSRMGHELHSSSSSVGELATFNRSSIGEHSVKIGESQQNNIEGVDDRKISPSQWLEQSELHAENYRGEERLSDLDDSRDDDVGCELGRPIRSYSKLTIDSIARASVIAEAREAQAIRAMDIAPDGAELVIGTNARALRILDVLEPLSTALGHFGSSQRSFLPLLSVSMEKHKHHSSSIYATTYNRVSVSDNEAHHPLIVASGAAESSIKVFSRANPHDEVWIRSHAGKCRALQFVSPRLLCSVASGDLVIRCWDLEGANAPCIQSFDGHVGEIQALALDLTSQSGSIDRRCLVSSSMDRTVRLWDLRTAQCARVLTKTPSPAFTVAFQPQEIASAASVLATGHQDGSVSLWDLRYTKGGQRTLATVSHHRDECRAVSWSPDGRWLLSASFDGTLCLLETSATDPLSPVASFHQHQDKILQAQWHPSQPAMITTGADKLVKLWGFS